MAGLSSKSEVCGPIFGPFLGYSRKCTIARSPRDHASDNLREKCCTKMVESSKMDTISPVLELSFVIQNYMGQNGTFFGTEIRLHGFLRIVFLPGEWVMAYVTRARDYILFGSLFLAPSNNSSGRSGGTLSETPWKNSKISVLSETPRNRTVKCQCFPDKALFH